MGNSKSKLPYVSFETVSPEIKEVYIRCAIESWGDRIKDLRSFNTNGCYIHDDENNQQCRFSEILPYVLKRMGVTTQWSCQDIFGSYGMYTNFSPVVSAAMVPNDTKTREQPLSANS